MKDLNLLIINLVLKKLWDINEMKRKLDSIQKEHLGDFLRESIKAIIEAELKTYQETEVSAHTARIYLFSNWTMAIVQPNLEGPGFIRILKQVIAEFKKDERPQISPENLRQYDEEGSVITAILFFAPSRMITADKDAKLNAQIKIEIDNGTFSPGKFFKDPDNAKYVSDVISIQVDTFYEHVSYAYKVVAHNDEVLDMPLAFETNLSNLDEESGGPMTEIKNLIEVE